MKSNLILISLFFSCQVLASELPTNMRNGTKDNRHPVYAFTNAHIFVDDKTELNNAVLIVQDDIIADVGENITVPENAIIKDLQGANIYPGFILMDSDYGLKEVAKKQPFSFFGKEVWDNTLPGAVNSNEAVKSSFNAVEEFNHDSKQAIVLRNNGFGAALISRHDGIMRGTSALVNLNDDNEQLSILNSKQAFHLSFDKGSSKQLYPISLMGAVALIRQTWLDAQWYSQTNQQFTDLDLQAITDTGRLIQIFHADNWQQTLLSAKVSKEFNKNIIIKTSGDEYKHLDAVKNLNQSLIVPLNFSEAPDVSDELDAWNTSYEKMKEWEASPYNFYYLYSKNIEFALVPQLNGQKNFLKDLRKVVNKGLPKSAALAALTSVPAKLLQNNKLGRLSKNSYANFIITQGDVFDKQGRIIENWVAGKPYKVSDFNSLDNGSYVLDYAKEKMKLKLSFKDGKYKLESTDDENKNKYKLKTEGDFATLEISPGQGKDEKKTILTGIISRDSVSSVKGQLPKWSFNIDIPDAVDDEKNDTVKDIPSLPVPFSAYGLIQPEVFDSYLIKNATVWTNEKQGVLENTDVYIYKGKISKVGKNLKVKADKEVDATGMHVSAGIIDEHSHIALLSVNDIAVNSSMVRMEDALDSDSIKIYRDLAGGVTAAQLLHGSANPIGGQSALIKMRWGEVSDGLLIENADKYIKFALGENVKRSRSQNSSRFPLTRMGVEQVYRDAFTNALEYEKQWNQYNKLSKRQKSKIEAPRRDLMMEATLEVVKQNRFISCHSYVQSEINMLMKVAEDFDFKVNTFTHILEGYKVADKMLEHGAGASSFADWWAYKWEVNYAIPYNAAILTDVGVTTAINSDDAEMSRRLNQEAAKSVKYGNMNEEEALKMVTLNPAKLLHLDDRMGSIREGKDADIVIWSDNPLSIYAKANKTFVDGMLLFDRKRQQEIEMAIESERERLIAKINNSSDAKMPAFMTPPKLMHCDSLSGYEYLQEEQK